MADSTAAPSPRAPLVAVSAKEAARRLGRAPHTLACWRLEGFGPPWYRNGSRIMYDVAELDAWFRATRLRPARAAITAKEA